VPLYATTVGRIRDELYRPGGGVRRYQGDTFYGGGQWILLAASLGWATLAMGDSDLAPQLLAWIEDSANDEGYLPEHLADDVHPQAGLLLGGQVVVGGVHLDERERRSARIAASAPDPVSLPGPRDQIRRLRVPIGQVPATVQFVSARRCPRCGTAVQPGGSVCERCELPLEGPAKVRYNPAGLALPSPVQGHATVMAGVIAAILLLGFTAWWGLHGIGPFHGQIVARTVAPDRSTVVVKLEVSNDGSRQGRASCQVTAVAPNGQLRSSGAQLSPPVAPHGTVLFELPVADLGDSHDVEATCA
jgi:hypothetical protein